MGFRRKYINIKSLVCLGLAWSSLSLAGTADLGGGTGVVCRDAQGRLVSVELLDLVEGEQVYKFSIPQSNEDVKRQAQLMIQRLRFGYDGQALQSPASYLRYVMKNIPVPLDPDQYLHAPSDLGKKLPVAVRNGCKLELIGARGKEESKTVLKFVPSLLEAMNSTHQAAFWVHEAIYSYYQHHFKVRMSDEEGTEQIRKLTAALFSANTGISQIAHASRFLFLPEKGKVYLAASASQAKLSLRGRPNAFETEFDQLALGDEGKFFCEDSISGKRVFSQFIPSAEEGRSELLLLGSGSCFHRVAIEQLNARFFVNQQEVLEVKGNLNLELIFLQDQKNYKQLKGWAEYPLLTDPKTVKWNRK